MDSAALGREREVGSASGPLAFVRQSAEDVAWLGLVPLTLLLLVLVYWLAPPLSDLYPGPQGSVFPAWRFIMRPEPLEATRFLIAAAGPALLAVGVLVLGAPRAGRRSLDPAVITVQIVGLGFLAWAVTHQTHVLPFTRPDYFDPLLLSVPNLVIGVVFGAMLTCLLASRVELKVPRLRAIADRLSGRWGIAVAVAVAFTALWLLPAVVTEGTVGQAAPIASGHIPAQAEDYFAVVNGRTPLVNYIPIYAHLLPLAVAPVLAAFDLSLTAFSISMCVLSLLALLAVYGTFAEVTRRPWAALALYLPFVAIALFPWDREGAAWDYNGSYYGFFPGRYLGPMVVTWLCALSLRRRPVPPWAVLFVAGLAIANNAEFGVPCAVAAIVALAFGADRSIPIRARTGRLAFHAAAGIGAALALVCVVILARSGKLPNPSFATYWSSTFARDGYGLVPIPTLGLHWALYFTFAAALLTASVRHVRTEPDRALTGMLGFAGVFGLLTGFYFAGRSVPFQLVLLFPVWGFALALLTYTAISTLRSARGDSLRLRRLVLPAFAVLAGFGVMVAAIDRFPPPWKQVDRLSAGGTSVIDQPVVQRFVDANSRPGERVLIIGTEVDHRIAERAGVVNTSPYFSPLSLLSRRDVDRAIDFLEAEDGRKAFIPHGYTEVSRILRERAFRPVRTQRGTSFVEWERR